MNEQMEKEPVLGGALTEDELALIVGGSDGPGNPTDGTGAR